MIRGRRRPAASAAAAAPLVGYGNRTGRRIVMRVNLGDHLVRSHIALKGWGDDDMTMLEGYGHLPVTSMLVGFIFI
uniref:Galectin n=1 Tax=Angiostrongylus cantonensis TaxID=6313 RepID=A0A0K0DAX7_ANGCA